MYSLNWCMFYSIPNDNHAIGAFLYILLLNEGSHKIKKTEIICVFTKLGGRGYPPTKLLSDFRFQGEKTSYLTKLH